MVRPEIVEYIEKELEKGFHIEEIKRALLSVGHEAQHVEEAVLHVHSKRQARQRKRTALIILIPVLIILILLLVVNLMRQQEKNDFLDQIGGGTQTPADNIPDAGEEPRETIPGQGTVTAPPEAIGAPTDAENLDLALTHGDISYCNKIVDPIVKEICTTTLNPPQREVPAYAESDSLLLDSAFTTGDISKCDGIVDNSTREICTSTLKPQETAVSEFAEQDSINFDNALANSDKTYCNNIHDEALKQTCLGMLG
ncbi:hypothetical protein J4227_04980 [Candidatus Woesearchaeota archaeon]|nr:hypothetical protein [Candidatus Woesearchaeota archaeon]